MKNVEPLSAEERRSLRALVGVIIPASATHGVPGADDELIFADILSTIAPEVPNVRAALARLDALAGGRFVDLDAAQRLAVALKLHGAEATPPWMSVVVQCYFRDDRVMRSLGMEARPPFPGGFEVEQGDWSLLDPVRGRPRFYRDA